MSGNKADGPVETSNTVQEVPVTDEHSTTPGASATTTTGSSKPQAPAPAATKPVSGGSSGTSVSGTVQTGVTVTTSAVKEFTVSGSNFSFSPNSFSVKKGDKVRVTFKNTSGVHDLRIDGYGVGTAVINGGDQQTFEFTADKAGSFEFFCSVGSHRAMGMKGTFTVTQ